MALSSIDKKLHRIEVESLRFLQLLELVLSSLFEVKAHNYQEDHKADAKQGENRFQDDFTGRHEKLNFPIFWLIDGRRDDKNLRVRDGLRPLAALLRQTDLNKVHKVWSSSKTENRVGQMKSKISRLRQLTAPTVLWRSFLSGCIIFDARSR